MSNKSLPLDDRLYRYLISVTLREPEVLQQLREKTSPHPLGSMQIAPEQGQFMAFLVELIGATKNSGDGRFERVQLDLHGIGVATGGGVGGSGPMIQPTIHFGIQ